MGASLPLLRDVDGQHVDAWGIRNEEYGPGTFAYGIPHPGVVLVSPNGEILAKWQRLATDLEQIGKPSYRKLAVFWVLADNC